MSEPRLTGTKYCSNCNKELPVIHFAVNRANKDGLYTYCRHCQYIRHTKEKAFQKVKAERAARKIRKAKITRWE